MIIGQPVSIRPLNGAVVKKPDGSNLSAGGEIVRGSAYWQRRIREGSVEEVGAGLIRNPPIGERAITLYGSLADRPPAPEFGKKSCEIITDKIYIRCTSTQGWWFSEGFSDSVDDRPAAADLGIGNWRTEDGYYSVSNGTIWGDGDITAIETAAILVANAKMAAEAARDAAQLSAGVYADTAAGLAATANTQYFSVPSADSAEFLILYRNESGVASEKKRYPSVSAVTDLSVRTTQAELDIDVLQIQTAPYQAKSTDMGGIEPIGLFAARGADGELYSLLAFLADGSISSEPLSDFILSKMGGVSIYSVEAGDWGAYVVGQRDAGGVLYALSGIKADGTFYAPGLTVQGASEILHIPMLGQSNMAADDSKMPLSSAATGWGALMFSRGVKTWSSTDNPTTPAMRADSGFTLIDLKAGDVETRANAMADAYTAKLLGLSRFAPSLPADAPKILISFSGIGGRKLTEVGPEDDGASGRPGARTPGGYWPTMLDDIARGKASAVARGDSYSVPAWVYDQGESEGDLMMYFGGASSLPSEIISAYYTKFLAMVSAFDIAVRGITGQTKPIPIFVTPPTYNLLTPTAIMNAGDNSPLVFIIGARYQMPSAKNASNGLTGTSQNWGNEIHYAPDGHRWIGEMCAKVMHRVLNEGEDWQPLRVLKAVKVDATHVDIVLHVPRPPLVIDTEFLPKANGLGITIYPGSVNGATGTRLPATAAEILPDGRTVRLTFSSVPAAAVLAIGQSLCDFGASYTAAAVGVGSATADGFSTYTVSIAGDIRGTLKPLTDEGAFWLRATLPDGTVTSQGIVRAVSFDGTNTVLAGEDRELRTGGSYVPFAAGNSLGFMRLNPYTNLRDSDTAMALNTFASGPRTGALYPLHNWLCLYDGMTVQGA